MRRRWGVIRHDCRNRDGHHDNYIDRHHHYIDYTRPLT
jgi:hypothetical protein